MPRAEEALRLSSGQRWALGAAALLALGLAAYGAAGSYETVSDLAAAAGVPLPGLVPVGIDGGLVGVVVLDLVLAWTGQAVGWLRQLARLLTVATVLANASAGWPSPLAVGLHCAAPMMLLVMVEAGRAVLLRRAGLASGMARDRIPPARWILSPWRTWSLWRRMVLWQITSYTTALDTEARLRHAHVLLRIRYGRHWRRRAPADLVWMLCAGPFVEKACALVESLVAENTIVRIETDESTVVDEKLELGNDQFTEVVQINAHHWQQYGRPVSAETVRKKLRVGADRARELTRAVRAADVATVAAATPLTVDYHLR